MNHRLYRNARIKLWRFNGKESQQEIQFQRQCGSIIKKLYEICGQLALDFRDFKGAMDFTGYFKDIKSFERILNEGLPEKYIRNLDIFEGLLKAIDKAFLYCMNGNYKLKHSDLETVKQNGEKFKDDGINQLWQLAVFARRTNPAWALEEEEACRVFRQEQLAKEFFEAMEGEPFEEIKGEFGGYYKIPKSICFALYNVLKQDPQIMKRLQAKFDRKDYPPFC